MSTSDVLTKNDPLQQLSDRQAIADLITRLGVMLDEKRLDHADAILANDVTVDTPGGSSRGRDAVVAQANRNHTVRTQHAITDVLIDLDGDRARARANLTVTFAPDKPGARLVIGGAEQSDPHLTLGELYRFEAIRSERGWRLARIEVARVWSSRPLTAGAVVGQTDRD